MKLVPLIKKVKKKAKHRIHVIWNSVQKARKEYYCHECEAPILPGFEYLRKVFVSKNRMWVHMQHESPPCEFFQPPPEDDEDFKRNDLQNAA